MRQLGPRHVEQQTAMAPFGALARVGVRFPGLIGDDQRDLGMIAQNIDGLVGARIVVGDNGIDLVREVVERVRQDQRLVADARHADDEVLLPEQRLVALDDLLAVTELPVGRGRGHFAQP